MPWEEVSIMDRREEFVCFAGLPGANISALCRSFGISRKTGYKWLGRAGRAAEAGDCRKMQIRQIASKAVEGFNRYVRARAKTGVCREDRYERVP